MKIRSVLVTVFFTFLASWAIAAPTNCPQHYFNGQAPDILNEKYSPKTQEICYRLYALIHSAITRTPLTSGEHLTAEVLNKKHAERKDHFHADTHLAPADRAELKDYEKSGYDRGHMSPVGDLPDEESQKESFSLANMIPQNENLNENLWQGIEEATRDLAKSSGELYVITGPIFYGSDLKKLKGRVLVPTYVFKAIYDPQKKQGAAYLVANTAGGRYAVVSIAEVERLTGSSLFPALANEVKQSPMALPKPTPNTRIAVTEDNTLVPPMPEP